MAYSRVNWLDNVTPLDQVHLNQMDSYIKTLDDAVTADAATTGAKVDKDSVVAAATRIVANKLLAGDANPVFQINGDGKHNWGPGGATAPDTNLYRTGAGILKTDNNFRVGNYLDVDFAGAGYQIRFGSSVDTNLYRSAAGVLKTDGGLYTQYLVAANDVYAGSAANTMQMAGGTGKLQFGSPADTNLYRASASVLKTDGHLQLYGGVQLDKGDGTNRIYWGSANDTSLYRFGANQLKTDGDLYTGNGIVVGIGGSFTDNVHGIRFGSGGDTSLYRAAANELKTDGYFDVKLNLYARIGGAAQVAIGDITGGGAAGLQFGSAADTNLYRAAAGVLKTDGDFAVTMGTQSFRFVGGSNDVRIRGQWSGAALGGYLGSISIYVDGGSYKIPVYA